MDFTIFLIAYISGWLAGYITAKVLSSFNRAVQSPPKPASQHPQRPQVKDLYPE